MKTWLQQRFNDVIFWITVVTSVSTIAYGYSTIRSSQVRVEEKCSAMTQRMDRVEAQLDRLVQQQGALK
jgi:hypothetical protein